MALLDSLGCHMMSPFTELSGETLGEAANFDQFWRRPQQLSDLCSLPWDNESWVKSRTAVPQECPFNNLFVGMPPFTSQESNLPILHHIWIIYICIYIYVIF